MELAVSGGGLKLPQIAVNRRPASDGRRASADSVQLRLEYSEATPKATSGRAGRSDSKQPTRMHRAKVWSIEVENAFRLQLAGFRDAEEYQECNGDIEHWPDGGMIKCLKVKRTGYFMYFRKGRECEDKHLNKIKIYEYN